MRLKKCLVAFVILIRLYIGDCFVSTFSEAEERPAIVQFFKYSDEISKYTAESIVNILLEYFTNLYNSVPEKHHGPTAAMVKSFIDNLEFAKNTGDTTKMEEAAADFDNIEERFLGDLMNGEREEIIVRQDSFQMIMMLRRVAEVSEKFLLKLNHAADALSAKFTNEGFGRHERLFSLLTELKNIRITEGHRPDQLLEQLDEIKRNYAD